MQYFSSNFNSDPTFSANPFETWSVLSTCSWQLCWMFIYLVWLPVQPLLLSFHLPHLCWFLLLAIYAFDYSSLQLSVTWPGGYSVIWNKCPYSIHVCIFDTVSYLAISDVLAVDLEELLCEGLFLLGGGWHHSGLAQGREHWRLNAFWSGWAIRVLEVGWVGVWTVIRGG